MEEYRDINGDSGVIRYEMGIDYIRVQFKTGAVYKYTYNSAGKENIEHMKLLAKNGDGLNAFINTTVRRDYEVREK